MLKTLFLALIFVLSSFAAQASDLTNIYMAGKSSLSTDDIAALSKYKILIIPGVLAQSFISDSDNQIKLTFLFEDGFKEQIALMKELNLDYAFLNLETENSPAENASAIISAIESSDKPVLIYSHSKGGLDTLEAIRQKPEILNKIHGWGSIQSPFWGAPVASQFNDNQLLKNDGYSIFTWMGGDASGMSSLSVEERTVYMNQTEVMTLLSTINHKIKFLNYASFKTNTLGIDTPLELFRNYTDEQAGANDGVVPLKSALVKEHGVDVNFIIEKEVDHLMTMTRYRLNNVNFNQKSHTASVLKLLL